MMIATDNHFMGMSRRDLQDNAMILLERLRNPKTPPEQRAYAEDAVDRLLLAWKKRMNELARDRGE